LLLKDFYRSLLVKSEISFNQTGLDNSSSISFLHNPKLTASLLKKRNQTKRSPNSIRRVSLGEGSSSSRRKKVGEIFEEISLSSASFSSSGASSDQSDDQDSKRQEELFEDSCTSKNDVKCEKNHTSSELLTLSCCFHFSGNENQETHNVFLDEDDCNEFQELEDHQIIITTPNGRLSLSPGLFPRTPLSTYTTSNQKFSFSLDRSLWNETDRLSDINENENFYSTSNGVGELRSALVPTASEQKFAETQECLPLMYNFEDSSSIEEKVNSSTFSSLKKLSSPCQPAYLKQSQTRCISDSILTSTHSIPCLVPAIIPSLSSTSTDSSKASSSSFVQNKWNFSTKEVNDIDEILELLSQLTSETTACSSSTNSSKEKVKSMQEKILLNCTPISTEDYPSKTSTCSSLTEDHYLSERQSKRDSPCHRCLKNGLINISPALHYERFISEMKMVELRKESSQSRSRKLTKESGSSTSREDLSTSSVLSLSSSSPSMSCKMQAFDSGKKSWVVNNSKDILNMVEYYQAIFYEEDSLNLNKTQNNREKSKVNSFVFDTPKQDYFLSPSSSLSDNFPTREKGIMGLRLQDNSPERINKTYYCELNRLTSPTNNYFQYHHHTDNTATNDYKDNEEISKGKKTPPVSRLFRVVIVVAIVCAVCSISKYRTDRFLNYPEFKEVEKQHRGQYPSTRLLSPTKRKARWLKPSSHIVSRNREIKAPADIVRAWDIEEMVITYETPMLDSNRWMFILKQGVKSFIKAVTMMPEEHQEILLNW
jgi:hypothetical protein